MTSRTIFAVQTEHKWYISAGGGGAVQKVGGGGGGGGGGGVTSHERRQWAFSDFTSDHIQKDIE